MFHSSSQGSMNFKVNSPDIKYNYVIYKINGFSESREFQVIEEH